MSFAVVLVTTLSAYMFAAGINLVRSGDEDNIGPGAFLILIGWFLLMIASIEADRPKKKDP